MKEGDEVVSTPIYMGDEKSIKRMASCTHVWEDSAGSEKSIPGNELKEFSHANTLDWDFATITMQRCKCFAARTILRHKKERDSDGEDKA